MAETQTPNFGWIKPDIGGDTSTWGNVLNTTIDAIDAVAFNNQINQGNYLPLVGGTVTGSLTVNGGVTAGSLFTDGGITANGSGAFNGGITVNGSGAFNGGITANGFANTNGYTVSQAAGSGNAYFVLNNNAGAIAGLLYWGSSNNQVVLTNQTGGGFLAINSDGSISTNGAFHTGNMTAVTISGGNSTFTGLTVNGDVHANGNIFGNVISATGNLSANGNITAGSYITGLGYCSKQGTSGPPNTSHFYNTYWNAPLNQNHLYLDNSDWGTIQTSSDYRMKKDVEPLGSMWGTVKALNPISYTLRDWTPPADVEHQRKIGGPLIRSDNIERWGFLAHELQETLVESAANGVKDDPVAVQSPNPFTVIAALTRALQEAMMRIEALEAAREG